MNNELDRLAIDTIRTLSIDGVQQANSGHLAERVPELGPLCRRERQGVGMHTFGASTPLKELQKKFGLEPEHIGGHSQRSAR